MTIGEISGAASVLGGGFVWVWKKIISPRIKKAREQKIEFYRKIDSIHKEVNFNGGSSIKDAIFALRDTTNRIEMRLDKIEDGEKVIMNIQGIPFWQSDKDGMIVYVSPAFCKIVARSEQELLGNNWISWVKEDQEIYKKWRFAVEKKTPFDEYFTFEKPNGELVKVWGLAFHQVIKDELLGSLGKIEKFN